MRTDNWDRTISASRSNSMTTLILALRHAILMRCQGKPLSDCEGVGYGNMPYAKQRPERSRGPQFARGSAGHPDGEFDVFTGT
jgi:hypothetical protein